MRRLRGADLLVETLQKVGIKTIFAVSGNHVMPIFDALIGRSVQLIHTRHEAAAVHMADAFARMSGTVGIALVTGGPGHVNALGALCTTVAGETPLILLSGHAALSEYGSGAFQELDQVACAAPLTKASWIVRSADAMADDLVRAWRIAQSGRPGPVHLSLPVNFLEAESAALMLPDHVRLAPSPRHLDPEMATHIIEQIRAARCPLIVVPPALCTSSGRVILSEMTSLGVPIIPMESPRGLNDPSLGRIVDLLSDADLILLLGKKTDFTIGFGAVAPQAQWIVIDPDEKMLERARRLIVGNVQCVHADTVSAISSLVSVYSEQGAVNMHWRSRVTTALARRPSVTMQGTNEVPNSATLSTILSRMIRSLSEPVFVCDGGEIGQWAQAFVTAPDRVINGVAGSIGSAIPFAIGAKAAVPHRPVVAVSGDGALGFHLAEFETAVRENLPFTVVVGNDSRWNAEHQLQIRRFGQDRIIGCDLTRVARYDSAAVALGGYGEYVTTTEAIEPALRRAIASNQPACVNVVIEGLCAP
jgi:acetolactate synthase-1/2/3 large subunit